jgi:hypothetical protein
MRQRVAVSPCVKNRRRRIHHVLVKLARAIDWHFLEETSGAAYTDKPGQPPLPTRLMAGPTILKQAYDLSDEVLCERWVENPYFQYFCGEEFFQHALVFDRSSLMRWRQRMGGREAYGDAVGKPGGGDPDASDEAVREIGVEGPESPPRI